MFAEMTVSKGKGDAGGVGGSPFFSCARYSSDLIASSPRTAYLASLTCGFMLSMFRLRRRGVDDMLRRKDEGYVLEGVLCSLCLVSSPGKVFASRSRNAKL